MYINQKSFEFDSSRRIFVRECDRASITSLTFHRDESGCKSEVNILVISEVTSRSISMKLRRAYRVRGRQQQPQNVKDFKAKESNRVSKHGSFKENAGSTSSGISFVVLSDSDSSQSDEDVLDLSVKKTEDRKSGIKGVKPQPSGTGKSDASNQLSKENEMQKFVESQGNSSETAEKISLAPGAMAEVTLGEHRLMSNTTDLGTKSVESPGESIEESQLAFGESSSDFTVRSGPSSPNVAANTARCGDCESLFAKTRRQPPPKTNSNKNPASLSCDQWILLKKWHPQRGRHREKGLLWTSLIQITKLAVQDSRNRARSICSRPHVFQQRNLRRCKYLTSIQTDLSMTIARPRHRRRQRPALWPPIGGRKPVKRKSSLNKTLSQQLFSPKLSVSHTEKDKPPTGSNTSSRQNSVVSPQQKRKNVQDRSDEQEACGGVEATRRVLKFEDTPKLVAVQTAKPSRGPLRRLRSGETRKVQKAVETKDLNSLQETLFEDPDGFKTPTDLFTVKRKIKRGSQGGAPASGDPKPAVQTTNFMSVLATAVRNQNKIIKETCP